MRSFNQREPALDEMNVRKMLNRDGTQLVRLKRLIDDMLDVSRINSGQLSLEKNQFDLCSLIQEIVDSFSAQIKQGYNQILFSSPCPIYVSCDRSRIEQVISNLVSNAIKYGGGTPIHVSAEKTELEIVIKVRDEGKGIKSEDQDRIFHRFERGMNAKDVSGLGLGLYIARKIVELHQGSILVESKPDEGTTFIVRLPISEDRKRIDSNFNSDRGLQQAYP